MCQNGRLEFWDSSAKLPCFNHAGACFQQGTTLAVPSGARTWQGHTSPTVKKKQVFHINKPEAPSYLDPTTWMDSKPKSFTTFRSLQNNLADFSWKKKLLPHPSPFFGVPMGQSCFQCFQRSQRRGNLVKETGPHCCWPRLSPTQKKCFVKLFHVQSCN